MDDRSDAVIKLGKLVLQFGRTDRATRYEDGVTPESDTDHTVMLAIIACAYAKEKVPHLDIGKIAQFALVHDLVEAYAGDTSTLTFTSEAEKGEKHQREHAALERIKKELASDLPWVHETIEEYESLKTPEARFVKTMDKGMPNVTHLLNGAVMLKNSGYTFDELRILREKQRQDRARTYAKDQPEAMQLLDSLRAKVANLFS